MSTCARIPTTDILRASFSFRFHMSCTRSPISVQENRKKEKRNASSTCMKRMYRSQSVYVERGSIFSFFSTWLCILNNVQHIAERRRILSSSHFPASESMPIVVNGVHKAVLCRSTHTYTEPHNHKHTFIERYTRKECRCCGAAKRVCGNGKNGNSEDSFVLSASIR